MTNVFYIFIVFIAPLALFAGAITWPRWFVQSMCKHRLWALRDDVSDDILEGRLPYSHPAVRQLALHIEHAVHDMTHVHIIDMWAFKRAIRKADPVVREVLRAPSLSGLTEEQSKLLCARREHMMFLAAAMVLLGSWIGVASVGVRAVPKIARSLLAHRRDHVGAERDAEMALRDATKETMKHTRLGRGLGEFVGYKVDVPEHLTIAA